MVYKDRIIVSACLAGEKCRYDGKSKPHPDIVKLVNEGLAIPLCPEVLGGLPVPRDRSEIETGDGDTVLEGKARITTDSGKDVTEAFIKGAQEVLNIAQQENIRRAILKAKSPSCGVTVIVKQGQHADGMGVTAALLKKHRISLEEI